MYSTYTILAQSLNLMKLIARYIKDSQSFELQEVVHEI